MREPEAFMKTNLPGVVWVLCALGIALPAQAESPEKTKAGPGAWPSPAMDTEFNWKRLKVTLGPPHIEGGTAPRIEIELQKLVTPLTLCYSRTVLHGSKVKGTADLTLRLNASGGVSNVRVTPPPGRGLATDMVSCWSAAARRAQFESPSTADVSVTFAVQFFPEQGPPEPPTPTPRVKYWGPVRVSVAGQTIMWGALLRDAGRVILGWQTTLKPCADLARGVPGETDLLGSFALPLTVAADGTVSTVPTLSEVMAQQFHPDPSLEKAITCVLNRARLLKFGQRDEGEAHLRIGVDFFKAPPRVPTNRRR